MLKTATVIANASITLWAREVGSLLGLSRRRIVGVGVAALLACLGLGAMLAVLTASQLAPELPAELRAVIFRTSFGGVVMTTALVSVILCLTVPAASALQTLLDMLPVRRSTAHLGQLAPVFVIALVFSVSLSATAFVIVWRLSEGLDRRMWAVAVVLVAVCVTQGVSMALFGVLRDGLGGVLRVPLPYRGALAAIVVILLAVLGAAPDVFALAPDQPERLGAKDLLPHRVFGAMAEFPPSPGTVLLALAWAGAAALLLWAASLQKTQISTAGAVPVLRGWTPRPGQTSALVWLEIVTVVRSAQFALSLLAAPVVLAGSMFLTTLPPLRESGVALASSVPALPLLTALYAVGRTLPFRWISTHTSASTSSWMVPKVLGNAVVGILAFAALFALTSSLRLVTVSDLPDISSRALAVFFLALFVGALVPSSAQQQMSSVAGGFLLGVLFVGTSLVTSFLVGLGGQIVSPVVSAGFAAIFALMFAAVGRRQAHTAAEAA